MKPTENTTICVLKRPSYLTVIVLLILIITALPKHVALAAPGDTTRVSVATGNVQANYRSFNPNLSGDGRYIVFGSWATNLTPDAPYLANHIFLHDRLSGVTERLPVNIPYSNSWGPWPVISTGGRYVAFQSIDATLVANDTNGSWDIFVYDRQISSLERVSVATNGLQGNYTSLFPALSADGRYIVFMSRADNLVPGDTNGEWDVFVHDRQLHITERVSVASNGTQADMNVSPSNLLDYTISADGRVVVFTSEATNLVPGDTNGKQDVFIHDRQTHITTRISVAANAIQSDGDSWYTSISSDGQKIAFCSSATNLVPGDTNGKLDVFVYNLQTHTPIRISVASDGSQGNNNSCSPFISGNGRYIAFGSAASNLVPNDTNGKSDIFVHDLQTKKTARVSASTSQLQADNSSSRPSISHNGLIVAFMSDATNLVPNDTNGETDIFVHERIDSDDLGFRPNINGFQFENTRLNAYADETMFDYYYGAENVRKPDGKLCAAAQQFFKTDYKNMADGYSCLGFSITSLISYLNIPQPEAGAYTMPYYRLLYEQPGVPTLLNSIAYYQRTQANAIWYDQATKHNNSCHLDSEGPIIKIKRGFETGDPFIINLFSPYKDKVYGHALIPYRIEELSPTETNVYVYDSEAPGAERSIHFQKLGQGWTWTYTFIGSLGFLGAKSSSDCKEYKLFPLSLALQSGKNGLPIAFCTSTEVGLQDATTTTYTTQHLLVNLPVVDDWLLQDSEHRRLGWQSGAALSEIPDASEIMTPAGAATRRIFYLPEAVYTIGTTNLSTPLFDYTLYADGHMLIVSGRTDTSPSAVQLHVQPRLEQVIVSKLSDLDTLNLTFDTELWDVSRLARIGVTNITGPQDLGAEFDGHTIRLERGDGTLNYTIKLQQLAGKEGTFKTIDIMLGANERHILRTVSWDNLTITQVALDIDRGRDGTIDETRLLTNQGEQVLLPLVMR